MVSSSLTQPSSLSLVDTRYVQSPLRQEAANRQGNGEWDSKVLQTLAGWVDLHSIHLYTTLGQEAVPDVKGLEYENNVFGPAVSCFDQCLLSSDR